MYHSLVVLLFFFFRSDLISYFLRCRRSSLCARISLPFTLFGLRFFRVYPMVRCKVRVVERIPQILVRVSLTVSHRVTKHLNNFGAELDSIIIHGKVLAIQSNISLLLISIYHITGGSVKLLHNFVPRHVTKQHTQTTSLGVLKSAITCIYLFQSSHLCF